MIKISSHMKTKIILLASVILFSSCKDDSISVQKDNGFSVKISVKDTGGNPIAGLRISSWNHLSIPLSNLVLSKTDYKNPLKSTCAIDFAIPIASEAELSVFEADGKLIETLWHQQFEVGLYQCNWSINKQSPTRVYKYRLTAKDTGGAYIFKDSSYAVLWQPDADISILGWTSHDGVYNTTDKLLFPNTLQLPKLTYTQVFGPDSIGSFTIQDTVTIVLTDTSTHKYISFTQVVKKDAENKIDLLWNPSLAKQTLGEEIPLAPVINKSLRRLDGVPDKFKLYQNYPNPFN
jgi:hypothetical protein